MIRVETESKDLAKQRPPPGAVKPPGSPTAEQLRAHGKAIRGQVKRSQIGTGLDLDRDPVKLLQLQNAQRLAELIPVRMGRMAQTPFTFFRGAAAVMAHDLGRSPVTGIGVQACGDAHLSNFGFFASPELELIFDLNDFDETHPAPWEWDLERLSASLTIAALQNGLSDRRAREVAMDAAQSYREQMARMVDMTPLQRFHLVATAEGLMKRLQERVGTDPSRKEVLEQLKKTVEKARHNTSEHALAKLAVESKRGAPRIAEQPPLLVHLKKPPDDADLILRRYLASTRPDVGALLDHYAVVDYALKVVGVGSVGTRCYIALSMDRSGEPMFLQVKEAVASVLEPYARKSQYRHHGQRVVVGQHLMQAASDPFLGWTSGPEGRHFYVRQFRDMKGSFEIDGFDFVCLQAYARLCGAVLARAHAQTSDPALIAGYLGGGDTFDEAMGDFAVAYAKQNEADHASLLRAIKSGKVKAQLGV